MTLPDQLQRYLLEHSIVLGPRSKILVACSGGPDSVSLVYGFKSLTSLTRHQFCLAHINHGLRGRESDRDEKFTRSLAKEVGWPFYSRKIRFGNISRGNLEEQARIARYNALLRCAKISGSRAIATAHTLDDQAETILMNLLRGTGLAGMGGIHPLRQWSGTRVLLARPLLEVTKSEILQFLRSIGVPYRKDKSNGDTKFLRNWVRLSVMPLLESRAAGFKDRLCRLAAIVREEETLKEESIEEISKRVLRKYRHGHLLDLKDLLRYPIGVQRRLLRRTMGRNILTFDGVEGLRFWMMARPGNGRLWQVRKGWFAERLSKTRGSPSSTLFWLGQNKEKISRYQGPTRIKVPGSVL